MKKFLSLILVITAIAAPGCLWKSVTTVTNDPVSGQPEPTSVVMDEYESELEETEDELED